MSATQNVAQNRKYRNAEWLREQYLEQDKTQVEIAAQCSVSDVTIHRWLNKFNIEKSGTATFDMTGKGYERWRSQSEGVRDEVKVHRLLATLKVDDLGDLDGKHVHHKSGVEWHNTLENIEVVTPAEHRERHA